MNRQSIRNLFSRPSAQWFKWRVVRTAIASMNLAFVVISKAKGDDDSKKRGGDATCLRRPTYAAAAGQLTQTITPTAPTANRQPFNHSSALPPPSANNGGDGCSRNGIAPSYIAFWTSGATDPSRASHCCRHRPSANNSIVFVVFVVVGTFRPSADCK